MKKIFLGFIGWCERSPKAGALAILGAILLAVFGIAQGIEWAAIKLFPDHPRVLSDGEREARSGGNFSVIIENSTDTAMVVSQVRLRAEPPPEWTNANFDALTIPAREYRIPFDCSLGKSRYSLRPNFKVDPKSVAAVVFIATKPMKSCDVYVSFATSQGDTEEELGASLAEWNTSIKGSAVTE